MSPDVYGEPLSVAVQLSSVQEKETFLFVVFPFSTPSIIPKGIDLSILNV